MTREDFNFELQELRTQLKDKRNEINAISDKIENLKSAWRLAAITRRITQPI